MAKLNLTLKSPATKTQIKAEIKKLLALLAERQAEVKLLRNAIGHYQNQCDHKGQKTGFNERDGSWGNPCPTCGYSY
jgi:hypothetical protein